MGPVDDDARILPRAGGCCRMVSRDIRFGPGKGCRAGAQIRRRLRVDSQVVSHTLTQTGTGSS